MNERQKGKEKVENIANYHACSVIICPQAYRCFYWPCPMFIYTTTIIVIVVIILPRLKCPASPALLLRMLSLCLQYHFVFDVMLSSYFFYARFCAQKFRPFRSTIFPVASSTRQYTEKNKQTNNLYTMHTCILHHYYIYVSVPVGANNK